MGRLRAAGPEWNECPVQCLLRLGPGAAEFPLYSSQVPKVGCCVPLQFSPYSELTRGQREEKGTFESGILRPRRHLAGEAQRTRVTSRRAGRS